MEMQTVHIIALLITGLGVGFASGLLGVGGCFIMVPVQFWALKSIGVDPTIAIRIVFGHCLRYHRHRRGYFHDPLTKFSTPGLTFGVLVLICFKRIRRYPWVD